MKKLFIIGNGFDSAHKLPTKYSDFREFLNEECDGQISYMPATHMGRDCDTMADRETTAGLLIDLIDDTTRGDKWEDFSVHVVGHGVNTKTGEPINFSSSQTGL